MVALSTQPIRFTPPWREGEMDAPVYFIRPGNPLQRTQFEAELAGDHRAGKVWPWALRDALLAAVQATDLPIEEKAGLADLVHAESSAQDEPLLPADRAVLDGLRTFAAEHWPDYRALVAQAERRAQFLPFHAFRRFVVGWEGLPVPFSAGLDGLVSLSALRAVPELEIVAAGGRAFGLLHAGHEAGNFAPPSTSAEGPAISRTLEPSAVKAGGSTDVSGATIP